MELRIESRQAAGVDAFEDGYKFADFSVEFHVENGRFFVIFYAGKDKEIVGAFDGDGEDVFKNADGKAGVWENAGKVDEELSEIGDVITGG